MAGMVTSTIAMIPATDIVEIFLDAAITMIASAATAMAMSSAATPCAAVMKIVVEIAATGDIMATITVTTVTTAIMTTAAIMVTMAITATDTNPARIASANRKWALRKEGPFS